MYYLTSTSCQVQIDKEATEATFLPKKLSCTCAHLVLSATVCSIMNSSTQGHTNPEAHSQNHDPAGLGELEQAILRMVWQQRQATAEQVREQLHASGRVLKESTVRTVLRRLEEKGYLAHTVEQRTYLYRAAEDGRSVEALLVGMVNADVLSEDELQRLAAKIARAKAKPGKSK